MKLIKINGYWIIVSDEKPNSGDWYLFHFDKTMGLYNNSNEKSEYYFKLIASQNPEHNLPSITFSDEVKQELRDKYGWIDVEELAELQVEKEGWGKFEGTSEQNAIKNSFKEGFKVHQSISNKMFSLEEMTNFTKWLDENWRRGGNKKGRGWFHVGDFYKQAKPIKTKDLMNKYVQSITEQEYEVEELEIEHLYKCKECGHIHQKFSDVKMDDNGFDYTYSCEKCIDILESNGNTYCEFVIQPKITNNSVKVIKLIK